MADGGKKKRETQTLEQLEARKARLEAQERELNERIKNKKQALKKQERAAETHAKVVLGAMVLARLGGNWKNVNFDAVDRHLTKYQYVFMREDMHVEEYPLDAAKKRLRNWETEKRARRDGNGSGEAQA